jgi:hypothetical protein
MIQGEEEEEVNSIQGVRVFRKLSDLLNVSN